MFEIAGQKNNKHWFYLAPALIVLTIFTFYPLTKTFVISFNGNYNKFQDTFDFQQLFSLQNYKNVFNNDDFRIALSNTLILMIFTVPISIIIALIIALALNSIINIYIKNFFKTFFFFPLLSNVVIMGMVFSMFFYSNLDAININKPEGILNSLLRIKQDWVSIKAPFFNRMFALIFYNVWTRLSFKIFVFVLSLQDINKSYYEAAKIDGTSKWRTFTKITLPLLLPTIFYQFIIEMLAVFKEYESVVGVFGKNANYQNKTIVFYIYDQLNNSSYDSYSRGSAAAMIVFYISVLFTIISFYISKKKINH